MPSFEVKPVRVFTREEPCTKIDLWNCFVRDGQFPPRAVVEARGEIGLLSIKYLIREGYATLTTVEGIDYWTLTSAGKQWLIKGTLRYLELHPENAPLCNDPPSSVAKPRQRIKRASARR